jgi:phosphoesterase RecJ-like protein
MKYLFNKEDIDFLKSQLSTSKKIVITTHHKPDGDALGSSLALYNFLRIKNHLVNVISPSDYPEFLTWMEGNNEVINFQQQTELAKTLLNEAELIFCLDFNSPDRVENLQEPLLAASAIKILIDHHLDPKDFCKINFSFPTAAATCEIVYYFINALGENQHINRAIAECLYAGIMTDTGSFRFPSMTSDLHQVIASLMEAGARNYMIHENVYDNYSENRLRLLGYCIDEKLVVITKYKTAYITVSEAELNKFHFQTGDTEGIVNYALGIKGIVLAAFFSQKNGLVKISFRSHGDFSVKELAEKHFSGGGHKNAAGGKSLMTLQQTVDKFIALLPGLNPGI